MDPRKDVVLKQKSNIHHRRTLLLSVICICSAVLLTGFGGGFAFWRSSVAPFTWIGATGDGLWSTAGNWHGGIVPTATDRAIFGSNCGVNCAVTIDADASVSGVLLQPAYTGTITQAAGRTITIGASGWAHGGGTFVADNSAITISGPLTVTGGTFTGSSGTVFRDLKNRGLDPSAMQLGIMDGLPGLDRVFVEEFPSAKVQRCQVHVARNVLCKVPKVAKQADTGIGTVSDLAFGPYGDSSHRWFTRVRSSRNRQLFTLRSCGAHNSDVWRLLDQDVTSGGYWQSDSHGMQSHTNRHGRQRIGKPQRRDRWPGRYRYHQAGCRPNCRVPGNRLHFIPR